MSLYTIFGGRGFIGSEIVQQLKAKNHEVFIPQRGDSSIFTKELGIVIYCAGSGDCQNAPFSVFEANLSLLANILQKSKFEKLLYISSTRVYMNQIESNENSNLTVSYDDSRRLFNLTKLTAEELCKKSGRNVYIIRPSNVYGVALDSPLFLPAITRNALNHGKVDMFVTPEYAKDYVSVTDVADITCKIAEKPSPSKIIYNIASGENTSALEIAKLLELETGCSVIWHENECTDKFSEIDITAIKSEFSFEPCNVLTDLTQMITNFKKVLTTQS
ncbi:NAD-dependent epimerase/dehydratase family protein [Pseudoalteromonas sp. ASV78]|uniref:NAD-dependent epimerase/dehydratase family protein n=1 Tax=Pseudoalteromonas sp. ASV78 TaxID=3397851 RepID=UPI0039FCFC16